MVLHLNVALNEPGSGIVHQDGTPANGVTPECCTQ